MVMAKKSKVDLDKLPSSMKKKTRVGAVKSTQDVKENRKPKTKEERDGEIKRRMYWGGDQEFISYWMSEEEKEQVRAGRRILAKSKEKDRKKFEKKVQEKMGSFNKGGMAKGYNKGGYVNCGASMKPNRMAKK
jgi:hypothetical protein